MEKSLCERLQAALQLDEEMDDARHCHLKLRARAELIAYIDTQTSGLFKKNNIAAGDALLFTLEQLAKWNTRLDSLNQNGVLEVPYAMAPEFEGLVKEVNAALYPSHAAVYAQTKAQEATGYAGRAGGR